MTTAPHAGSHPSLARPTGGVELIADREHLDRILLEGVSHARISLDIATADFKAVLLPGPTARQAVSIVTVLRKLAERGVEVRLLHAGVPSGPARDELRGGLPDGLTIRRCPRLHAKFIIIDACLMYLGSANLTGAGLGAKAADRRNFELGIRTTDSGMIDQAMGYFNAIWEGFHCETCKRRDVCPEPLEEPDL